MSPKWHFGEGGGLFLKVGFVIPHSKVLVTLNILVPKQILITWYYILRKKVKKICLGVGNKMFKATRPLHEVSQDLPLYTLHFSKLATLPTVPFRDI